MTAPDPALRIAPVTAEDAAALAALFLREGSPCFCRYWHFTGTNKEWEARCGLETAKNREELEAGLLAGTDDARGLVAHLHNDIIGWMKLAPRSSLPKLLARVPYRDLDAPRGAVFAIGCFLVDPAHRRKHVAEALVRGALEWAPRWGASHVEAYPRTADGLHEGEMWTGPAAVFVRLGFEIARESLQYPVLRKKV